MGYSRSSYDGPFKRRTGPELRTQPDRDQQRGGDRAERSQPGDLTHCAGSAEQPQRLGEPAVKGGDNTLGARADQQFGIGLGPAVQADHQGIGLEFDRVSIGEAQPG